MSFEFVFLENSCHFYFKMIRKLIQKWTKNDAFGVSKTTCDGFTLSKPKFGGLWERLGGLLGRLGGVLGRLEASWKRLGCVLGPS